MPRSFPPATIDFGLIVDKDLTMSGQRVSQREEAHAPLEFQGATLRALRQRKTLTLRDLARRLGVTYQAVHNWEKGINDPSAELLPVIAQELACEIGDLYLKPAPFSRPITQVSVADQDFLEQLFAALLLEGVPRQSAEEARDLAARLVTEARTPPDHATGVSAAAEALIRVRTLLRQRKR
jgi:transcriptional regulator with XRE-family HTH domain